MSSISPAFSHGAGGHLQPRTTPDTLGDDPTLCLLSVGTAARAPPVIEARKTLSAYHLTAPLVRHHPLALALPLPGAGATSQ